VQLAFQHRPREGIAPQRAPINCSVVAVAWLTATTLAFAQSPSSSHSARTQTGATFTVPEGWTEHAAGALVVLDPAETDTHVAIVDIKRATDAKSAGAAAWELYRSGVSHSFKLLTANPPRNGWDEQAVIHYETSPNEHLTIYSIARRKGTTWTIAIIDGSESTTEKRSAAIEQMLTSLRPAGFVRETFAGRTAHRLDPIRVASLLDFVRHSAAELNVPGVGVALIDHDKIVYEGGIGVREMGKSAPVDAHTLFMIASNTKSMSTLLLAELVDEDRLRWDEPVVEAYPLFRLGREATTKQVRIRHLVCACTGLPSKDFEWGFTTTAKTPSSHTFDLLATTEPTSGFGEVFQYSNLMAAAAGYVAAHIVHPERELGAAYDAAMQEKVFGPLGMRDTTFSMPMALAADHASPHGKDLDGKLQFASLDIAYAVAPFRPQGGAWSSPHDMILYVRNELAQGVLPSGRRLVSAANLLERRKRGVPIGEDQWYGMGLVEDATWGVSFIDHQGDIPGYHSDFFVIPNAQVGAVILTNSENGHVMLRPFIRRLLEILYDGQAEAVQDLETRAEQMEAERIELRRRVMVPPTPADLAKLASVYENPDLGKLIIEKHSSSVRVRAVAWSSAVAARHNEDGTTSLISTEPGFDWLNLVVESRNGIRTLTTADGQHTYKFTETHREHRGDSDSKL
jgi:CubicO group peptidase (beta-lactamase class C family)